MGDALYSSSFEARNRMDIVASALALCEKYDVRRQRYFDMQWVAVMMAHDVELLLTENVRDFADIEEVSAVNSFVEGLDV